MQGEVKKLKDGSGNYILPVTSSSAVITTDGKKLEDKFIIESDTAPSGTIEGRLWLDLLDTNTTNNVTQSAKAVKTIAQGIPNDTGTILTFESKEFDTNNLHDNSTNNSRIICKVSGIYLGSLQIDYNSNPNGIRWAEIRKNSVTNLSSMQTNPVNGGDSVLMTFGVFTLNVGDYIEAIAWQTSGGVLNVKTDLGTYMSLTKIG